MGRRKNASGAVHVCANPLAVRVSHDAKDLEVFEGVAETEPSFVQAASTVCDLVCLGSDASAPWRMAKGHCGPHSTSGPPSCTRASGVSMWRPLGADGARTQELGFGAASGGARGSQQNWRDKRERDVFNKAISSAGAGAEVSLVAASS